MTDYDPTILHVDDDSLLRAIFGLALEKAGFRVVSAGSGREALQVVTASRCTPDVVMLDLEMPVMNGLETLSQFKGLPQLQEVPVIVVSAYNAGDKRVLAALDAGAVGYVSKVNLNIGRLPEMVRDYLQAGQEGEIQ